MTPAAAFYAICVISWKSVRGYLIGILIRVQNYTV